MEFPNASDPVIAQRQFVIPHYLIFTILTYIITTSIILVNGSILLAFIVQKIRKPTLARLSPAGLLVLNLLAADAFVGVVTIVMTATETDTMAKTKWCCAIRVAVSYLALIGSHVALINVATDRYVAIMHTLRYREWMTMRRSWTMVLTGWMVPVAGAAGAILSNDWTPGLIVCEKINAFKVFLSFVWVPSNILALLCVILIQGRVYLQLRQHETSSETTNNVLKQYSKKSVQMLYRVTTTFVLCWGPFDIVLLVIIVFPNPVLKIVYDTSAIVAHISFLVNPSIYSYKTENIRKPVNALFSDIKAALRCRKAEDDVPRAGMQGTRTWSTCHGGPGGPGGDGGSTATSKLARVTSSISGRSSTQSTSLEGRGYI